jgi:hypothetical protein
LPGDEGTVPNDLLLPAVGERFAEAGDEAKIFGLVVDPGDLAVRQAPHHAGVDGLGVCFNEDRTSAPWLWVFSPIPIKEEEVRVVI